MAKKTKNVKRKTSPVKKESRKKKTTKARVVPKKTAARKKAKAAKTVATRKRRSSKRVGAGTVKRNKTTRSSTRKKLTPIQEKLKFQELLMLMRARITGQVDFLTADNLSRSRNDADPDFKSEEQGTDNYNRDFALSRVSMEQNAIFEIDEALQRIKLGTYGACENCGKRIEKNRLAAIPHSRLCVACQSATEAGTHRSRASENSVFRDAGITSSDADTDDEEK